ncbi:hypothetical protein GH714_017059 [Hevea brasiliensis]|uniref:O-fucosyltransferase family protein n=1 Tax=Hevea brasiliensis TaxID=3981 RepID=A0A6A6KSC1_HEVBR|nr:hypothetical protein GH714_017059 [Hevea brasiliensis]
MMLYMGSLSFDVDLNLKNGGVVVRKRPPPGSVYRSPQICDAVAVAGLLNATLVIPFFHLNSVWQDSRIRTTFKHCKLGNKYNYENEHIKFKGTVDNLEMLKAVRIAPFSNRLAQAVPPDIQRLRCLANFEALRIWLHFHAVGMMLRGMGFYNTTSVYVAAGNIYKADKFMAPLKRMFPRLETKDTLATTEELAPFKGHSSRLAALDYTVCLHSEVFVTTQGGNFPHFLMGHRRYLYGGHAKTIKPDKKIGSLI